MNRTEARAVNKAYEKVNVEMKKQLGIIMPAAAVVLWKDFGWRKTRIIRRFNTTAKAVNECADYGPAKSMMQMLEEETGIELQFADFQSFHEFQYLDSEKWDGKGLTPMQMIAMYGRMKKWIAPQILAGLCLALHRDEGFGAERLGRFIGAVDAMRQELGEDPKRYTAALEEATDISAEMLRF